MEPKVTREYYLEEMYSSVERMNQAIVSKNHNQVLEERALQRRLRALLEKLPIDE